MLLDGLGLFYNVASSFELWSVSFLDTLLDWDFLFGCHLSSWPAAFAPKHFVRPPCRWWPVTLTLAFGRVLTN